MTTPSPSPHSLPERPDLRKLKDMAKAMVKDGSIETLSKAQLAVARRYGFPSWPKLKSHVNTILFITACRSGDGSPEDFVDQFTDLEAKGPANHTPLGSATFHRQLNLACTLLDRGANPNALYANDRSPLFGAVAGKNLEMMRLLLNRGADVNLGIPKVGHTPLHRAASFEEPASAETLLSHGAAVNVQTIAPNLDFPCFGGEVGEETAIHYAAGFGGLDVIRCLLEHGATTNVRNKANKTPLDWALDQDRPPEVLALLREATAQ
ncbi:MAG: ankyrin repeat domain-containing protein [Phycisphaeraceae bacterium]